MTEYWGGEGGGAVSIFVFFNYPQLCKVACHLLKSNTSKSNSQAPLPLITELSGLAISLVCKIICKSNHTDKPFIQAKSYYLLSYRKTKTLEKEKRGEKRKKKKESIFDPPWIVFNKFSGRMEYFIKLEWLRKVL